MRFGRQCGGGGGGGGGGGLFGWLRLYVLLFGNLFVCLFAFFEHIHYLQKSLLSLIISTLLKST